MLGVTHFCSSTQSYLSLGTAPRVMAHDLLSYAPLAGGRNVLLYTNSVPKDAMSVYFEFIGSLNSQ